MGTPSKTSLTAALMIAMSLAVLPAPATAGCCGADTTDPADVRGKLDLAALQWEKTGADAPVTIAVRTHEGWRAGVLRAPNRLVVAIDADGDDAIDYRGRIRRVDGHLTVFIRGSGRTFEPLPAHKPDGRTVQFTIPGGTAANPPGNIAIFARSRYVDDAHCSAGCADRAPDAGRIS